jgi:hypothetical protein
MSNKDPFDELAKRLLSEDKEFTSRTEKIIKNQGAIPNLAIIILTLLFGFGVMIFSLIIKTVWLGVLAFGVMVFILASKLSNIKIDNRSLEDFINN